MPFHCERMMYVSKEDDPRLRWDLTVSVERPEVKLVLTLPTPCEQTMHMTVEATGEAGDGPFPEQQLGKVILQLRDLAIEQMNRKIRGYNLEREAADREAHRVLTQAAALSR